MRKDNSLYFEDKVRLIIADALCIEKDKVKPDSLLKKLGADYLDLVLIQMNLEDMFHLVIPDRHLANKNKVSEIINYIKERTDASVPR